MAEVKVGMKEPFAAAHECPRAAAAERSESLVSDYSSAPRQNGVLHCLLPDLRYLDGVTASSVSGVFILLLSMCVVIAFFFVCRVWGPPMSLRVGTVYMLLCSVLQ